MIEKLHNAAGIGAIGILVLTFIGVAAWASIPQPKQPKQLDNNSTGVAVHIVEAPAPEKPQEPVQAPVAEQPTPAPSEPPTPPAQPVVPAEDPVIAQRKAWISAAGIDESYETVDRIVARSGWNNRFIHRNQVGLCAHILPTSYTFAGPDEVRQLIQCNEWIKKLNANWQDAAVRYEAAR